VCDACATRKLSGAIKYELEPTAAAAEGEILLCCALPSGPVTLDL
jgi:hypothetical protein